MTAALQDVRVLVLADDPLMRAGLAALLAQQAGCEVTGQAAPGDDLLAEVAAAQADLVVADLGWQPAAALAQLAAQVVALPPTLLLLPSDTNTAGLAVSAWQAGIRGLIARRAAPEAILAAARSLLHGQVVLTADLADDLLLPAAPPGTASTLAEALTAREDEVLQLLAEGMTNRAIAQRLAISEHTVKFHVNAILGKLGAQSRADAVMRATRLGLILL